MSDGERIIAVINYLKLTKRQFAISIGYPTGDVIYNIEKGKSKLNRKLVDIAKGKGCFSFFLLYGPGIFRP